MSAEVIPIRPEHSVHVKHLVPPQTKELLREFVHAHAALMFFVPEATREDASQAAIRYARAFANLTGYVLEGEQ